MSLEEQLQNYIKKHCDEIQKGCKRPFKIHFNDSYVEVPCGRCPSCKVFRRKFRKLYLNKGGKNCADTDVLVE